MASTDLQIALSSRQGILKTAFLLIAAIAAGVGCGGSTTNVADQVPVYQPAAKAAAASTLDFIPQLQTDKKGNLVPYVPSENPYLKKKSRVSKAAVDGFVQAQRLYQAGELAQAEATLKQVLESSDKLSGPWVMLGDIAAKEGELNLAKDHLLRAIVINEYNVNAYLRLAMVKRKLGDFTGAKQVYADVLTIWKDFPEAHLNLGILYDIYLNDDVKAQRHIEAYQFLTGGKNTTVAGWLAELQKRTGMQTKLNMQQLAAVR